MTRPPSPNNEDHESSAEFSFEKARFVQRFRHLRQSFAARRVAKETSNIQPDPVATLPSTYSVHEFHNYGFQGTGISPGLHFHLSGTINALTDIPLVPSLSGQGMQCTS